MKPLAILLPILLACHDAAPVVSRVSQAPARVPAPVMSAHGADWLERAEREAEEQPQLVIDAMKLRPGDVVAEVGAGSGYMTRRLARAVAPTGVVYANDIQSEMLDRLRENAARERITGIVPILGSEEDPKLPKGALDWILLVDVYHEFQQPAPMLARMRESLKAKGKIALVEYRAEGDSADHIRAEHRMSREQVLGEWLPAGYRLESIVESLPSQRLFIFSKTARGPGSE